ncbi:hypothetical protein M5689_018893 [Euphorbia peplus]|nr:hypothetical protein M5689_018893 [Euphorbia peplus]
MIQMMKEDAKMGLHIHEIAAQSSNHHRRRYVRPDHEDTAVRLHNDYFALQPVYSEDQFRRRSRMRKDLFELIMRDLGNHINIFLTKG